MNFKYDFAEDHYHALCFTSASPQTLAVNSPFSLLQKQTACVKSKEG